jgi:F-type H+-transporting ATPase subunit gamma
LYAAKLDKMLKHLAAASSEFDHPFFAPQEINKTGVIIVGADRGLCGSYNAAVFSAADRFLKSYKPENIDLILIGRKTINHYKRKHWPIRHEIREWGGKITFTQVKDLAYQLVQWFLSKDLNEIWLIYTHFISILSRKVVQEKFLGLEKPQVHEKEFYYIFEPNPTKIYAEILPRYTISKIQTVLDEAYASELAARAFSMRKATKNAEELIVELTLVRNKLRQSNITREIIEITTGAEGLK